jgi:hypothetical protein
MLADFPASPLFTELSLEEVRVALAGGFSSAVGHADTAAVFADVTGLPVETARVTVCLRPGDMAIVGQYRGPRLPEGAKHLPPGASIQWIMVTL